MTRYTRRDLMVMTSLAALMPGASLAQSAFSGPAMGNRLAELAGFDALPRDLLAGLRKAIDAENALPNGWSDDQDLPDDVQKRILRGLYSGVLPGDDAKRIGFSSALMWAAIEDTNNVISYCGGAPGFWAEPPTST